MTIKYNKNMFFEDFENRLKVIRSPEVDIGSGLPTGHNQVIANLIVFSPPIYKLINKTRGILKNIPKKFPQNLEKYSFEKQIFNDCGCNFQEIKNGANIIRQKYRLGTNWITSIISSIVYHTILIPPALSPIRFRQPFGSDPILGESSEFRDWKNAVDTLKYPSIYFTGRVTTSELVKWIKKYKSQIDDNLKFIPKNVDTKLDVNTLFWGQIAWIQKQSGVKKWKDIIDNTEEFILRYEREKKANDKMIEEEIKNIPDEQNFNNFYKRFLSSVYSLEK